MSKSKPFYVWDGLFEPKHRATIGVALWEFQWCVSRITREVDGVGSVCGGRMIKVSEIGEALGMSEREVRNNLGKLQAGGYLWIRRGRYGLYIDVLKSKRWVRKESPQSGPKLPISDRKEVADLNPSTSAGSCRSERKEVADLDSAYPCATETSEPLNLISNKIQKQENQKHVSADADALPDSDSVLKVATYHREHVQPKSRMLKAGRDKIKARLKTFSPEDLMLAVDQFRDYRDKDGVAWWMDNCGWRGLAWFFHTDNRVEQFLNLEQARGNGRATIQEEIPLAKPAPLSDWVKREMAKSEVQK